MRILRIIAGADPAHGGPIEGVFRVGAEMAKLGHVQDVATLDAPDAPYLASAPARIIPLGNVVFEDGHNGKARPPLWKRFGYAPRAVPWLRAHLQDYDVAIVSGLWNYAAVAARRALVGGKTPYVVFTHGMLDPWFKRTYRLKSVAKQLVWLANEGPLLRCAENVLFTSEEERLVSRNAFWPYHARERVVSYGTADVQGDAAAQVAGFRALLPALGERRYLLFLSRIHEKKGCDLLVEAYAEIAARAPDLDLVIAGPDQTGWRAELEKIAQARGVAGRIHWPGMVKGEAKWGAYRGADAFVLPSHQENFGIVVAEAMACGIPVLTTDKVNIWREIEADGAGLIAPDDLAGTRRLLECFLALDGAARASMGTKARESFLRRFEIGHAASDLVAALQDAIGSRRAAA